MFVSARAFGLFLVAAIASACGSTTVERPVESFLVVGVDMQVECDRVRDSLALVGLHVVSRVDQPRYCALSAASTDAARTAVRIVTPRGIVYAADGEVGGLPGETSVTLLAPPGGHAGSELLVARAESGLIGRCIEVVEIDGRGQAQPVPLELDALAAVVPVDSHTCIGEVLDLDGDGTAEAYVIARAPLRPAPHARAPAVRVPLAPGPRGFVYVAPAGAYWRAERRTRAELLGGALAAHDFASAHTLGVELALIARLAGESVPAQLAAYDGAIAGLSIGAEQQALVDAAHASLMGD